MNVVTLCYSNHRPETLEVTLPLMESHEVIVLEEPPHPRFQTMLEGKYAIDELLLELDTEYPSFVRQSYQFLQHLRRKNKTIEQVEPYLEYLEQIHLFFADGHSPAELERGSELEEVYLCEREATGALIDFYKASRGDSFNRLLAAISRFAKADARRFRLRDTMRAAPLLDLISGGQSIFIEAGGMHRYLFLLLQHKRPPSCMLKMRWVEQELMLHLSLKGHLLSPGDILTLAYIFKTSLTSERESLLCARALLYAKIVHKEEITDSGREFPHLRHDLWTIRLVNRLSFEECSYLYADIAVLSTAEAEKAVTAYLVERGKR